MKALLLENIHSGAVRVFKAAGFKVEAVPQSPGKKVLAQRMEDVSVLGIRSKTRLGPDILARAPNLFAIGAFCIGTEQIDLSACSAKGIAVFNAPYSNTRSVVEMALGEMILLLRGAFESSNRLHGGVWAKSAEGFHEIRGKRLGIIGYGNIGSQLSTLAESLGMEVGYCDIEEKLSLGNARKYPLKELLGRSDIITVHIDGRESNRNFVGEKEFAAMKEGAVFLNLSRGFVVDVEALARHIKSGRVRGAAIDVFPEEPESSKAPFSSPLQGLQNVILTPHVGGSTEEAQAGIGDFVAERIVAYFATGSTVSSVNFPVYHPMGKTYLHRFAHIHENIPGMLAQINEVFARRGINIAGQHLETRGAVGYAIIDADGPCGTAIVSDLEAIPNTIRARLVY
ncbi:MAG: phosphoglycerate dehydrogenase [Deltaproteobacteria bacterium]|nr:phosphoglycerate dehydrogenase [Deltaproteobacteria bacterium]MDH3382506.1 phosphoglycerate dehydrogenase [Deltaproteobacteria bacterium]